MNSDFPRILSLLRKERHLSQKEVAASLGVAQALLSHYEKGKRECGLDFLVKAADYYNVSTDYLLGRSASSTGAILTEKEIPEASATEKAQSGVRDISATMSKKLLTNSIEVVYSLLSKIGNSKLTSNVTNLLTFSVYRAFRLTYRANPKNNPNIFEISEDMAYRAADAGSSVAEGNAAAAAQGDSSAPEITTGSLESEYRQQAPALLNLIKNSEAQLKKYI